jgi:hypothetical protein
LIEQLFCSLNQNMISFFHFDFKLQVIFDILQVLLISLNQRF